MEQGAERRGGGVEAREGGGPDLEALLDEIKGTLERLALRRHSRQALKRARERLLDIAPRDAVEDMLAVQLVVAHEAALDASARSLDPGLSDEGRRLERRQAEKFQKLCLQIVAALDKHRRQAARGEGATEKARAPSRDVATRSARSRTDEDGASEVAAGVDVEEDDHDDNDAEPWVALGAAEDEGVLEDDDWVEDNDGLDDDGPLPGDPRARRAVLQERERARAGARRV